MVFGGSEPRRQRIKVFVMRTYENRLRAVGAATIAFTLLLAPTLSMARPDQQGPTTHVAKTYKTYPKKHASRHWRPSETRNLYGSAQGRCAWPYQNRIPPCMSTFPEGSPHYHGPQSGVTFDNQ